MDELSAIIGQVWALASTFKTLSQQQQVASIVLVLISLWKTSIVRNFLWDKLGDNKILVAPILGVVYELAITEPLTWAAVWAGLQGGLLAIALHELLDKVKQLPKVGDKYKSFIEWISKLLKKPEPKKEEAAS